MIELIINNKTATLPNDFELSIVIENEFFSKSSGYSLDLDLPAKERQNIEIFGPISRLDVSLNNLEYEAELRMNSKVILKGTLLIISVSPDILTVQILSDTSSINYSANKLYIDEIKNMFGRVPFPGKPLPLMGSWVITKDNYTKMFGSVDDVDMVFLWGYDKDPKEVKDRDGQPNAPCLSDDYIFFKKNIGYLSCQPYLIKVIKYIMNSIGYRIGRNDINTSWLRNLYIVNFNRLEFGHFYAVQEGGIDLYYELDMTRALPHWKLSQFIEEVEKFCACVFIFKSETKTVDIVSLSQYYSNANTVVVSRDNILAEFEKDTKDNQLNSVLISPNIGFDGSFSNVDFQVDKDVVNTITYKSWYKNFDELQQAFNTDAEYFRDFKLYVNNEDGREYISKDRGDGTFVLSEINVYADLIRDPEVSDVLKLKIKPASTQLCNVKWFSDDTESPATVGDVYIDVPYGSSSSSVLPPNPRAEDVIKNGYNHNKPNSSSEMQVMLSTGDLYTLFSKDGKNYNYPLPFADNKTSMEAASQLPQMSLSLKDVCENSLGHLYRAVPSFSYKTKYIISFISNIVPDVRRKFIIDNKTYACYKLTYKVNNEMNTFTIEGEFYQMTE